jgi:hypothetical protein
MVLRGKAVKAHGNLYTNRNVTGYRKDVQHSGRT